jgi:phage terminase Nu1 subunit (DNA packaging protein)
MSSETYLNASEAKDLLGVSMPTFQKWLKAKEFPNAKQRPKGKVLVWEIPLSDLQNSGKLDRVTSNSKEPSKAELSETMNNALRLDLDRLETELRLTKELLARADQELESYRQRERYLFATLETRATQEARRSLWQRLTGK